MEEKDIFELKEECLLIKMPKEVDHHCTKSIKRSADLLLCDNRVKQIVFDFKDTTFMDSAGIGLLAGRNEKISYLGGRCIVTNANERVQKILRISGLDQKMCVL